MGGSVIQLVGDDPGLFGQGGLFGDGTRGAGSGLHHPNSGDFHEALGDSLDGDDTGGSSQIVVGFDRYDLRQQPVRREMPVHGLITAVRVGGKRLRGKLIETQSQARHRQGADDQDQ
ncbi:Uncharacterised protein [Mycobacteroides abscessus subsp. abscessus]|nr:Uncharacterised protein [Mycobacteroides abscessus subsp. abscessus]